MNTAHKKLQAFTLIELMIALIVLAILLSIGVANYTGMFARQELIQTTERLYHFLRLAETQAVLQNRQIYVHFCESSDSSQWKMGMTDLADCDCFTANSCLLNGNDNVAQLADGKGVFVENAFSLGKQASYKPMRFGANTGNVTLSDLNGNQLRVVQSSIRLRICSPEKARLGYKKC